MDPFVAQLARLCTAHRTRAKWVFVPTHALGRTLGDRLVLEGTDWANLRFVTPLDIALRMGAPFLVERGIDPSEEGLGPALIMRLLLDLPEEGGYFRSLADQPTMAQALWSTVRELRMAGVRAAADSAGRLCLTGQAQGAPRAADGVRDISRHREARGHGHGLRRGGSASRLVPDPADGLLDRVAGRAVDPVAARPDRQHAGRTRRAARARDRRLDAAAPVCRRTRRTHSCGSAHIGARIPDGAGTKPAGRSEAVSCGWS